MVDEPTSAEWVIGEWVTLDRELCAEPASGPSAPRSGGGAKRRALTPVSTRGRCWLDDAAGDHNILRSTGVQFPSERSRSATEPLGQRTQR